VLKVSAVVGLGGLLSSERIIEASDEATWRAANRVGRGSGLVMNGRSLWRGFGQDERITLVSMSERNPNQSALLTTAPD
jgi:hypothetical protein